MSKKNNSITGINLICKELETIMNFGYSNYQVFEDWVGLMFYSFQHNTELYNKILEKYNPKQKIEEHFSNALWLLLEYMKETNNEVLGELYMKYASNKYKGQFFTPMSISRISAGLTLQNIPKDRRFTIGDPACGAGIMFVAAAKEMTYEENNRAIFVGVDVDLNCVRMCCLNMMFFNLNSIIIWGNSLSLECRDAWTTKRNVILGGSLHHIEDLSICESWIKPFKQK